MNKPPKKVFCIDEKQTLINFVKDNKGILENKTNDAKTIKARKEKWEELSQCFAAKGYDRDWQRLREHYHRMKCSAKSTITSYEIYIKKTGRLPDHTPNDFDWAIRDICPDDFTDEVNQKEITTVSIKQENSEDSCYEQINYNDTSEEHTIGKKRKSSLNHELAQDIRCEQYDPDSKVENYTTEEFDLLEQKEKYELELHKQRLEFAREKHLKEMECANITEQKLKLELETARINKLKMEKESVKLDLELEILHRKLNLY